MKRILLAVALLIMLPFAFGGCAPDVNDCPRDCPGGVCPVTNEECPGCIIDHDTIPLPG
jgi:hypothetical protein